MVDEKWYTDAGRDGGDKIRMAGMVEVKLLQSYSPGVVETGHVQGACVGHVYIAEVVLGVREAVGAGPGRAERIREISLAGQRRCSGHALRGQGREKRSAISGTTRRRAHCYTQKILRGILKLGSEAGKILNHFG